MHKLISTCQKCGNPIYICDYNQQVVPTERTSIVKANEILPHVLRTCNCTFENAIDEKRIDNIEKLLSIILEMLSQNKKGNDSTSLPSNILND